MNERHLLWEYAKTRSDAAFEKLVSRHVDLVYCAALRQLGDAHQAEDVLHAVFMILAEKAPSLPRNVILPAWLLETTRLAVLDARRNGVHAPQGERSAESKPVDSKPVNPHDELLSLLDEVLAHLSINDRNALVLHYFEKRPLGEVSAALAILQSTAYKWISRGLENMCLFFVRRGVKVSAGALSTVLQTRTVVPAPPEIAARILASLDKTNDGLQRVGAGRIAKNAIRTMAFAKFKTTFVKVAAACVLLMAGAAAASYFLRPKPVHVIVLPPRVDVPVTAGSNSREPLQNNIKPRDDNPPPARAPSELVEANPPPRPPKPPEPLEKVLARLPLRAPSKEPFIDVTQMIDPEIDAVVGAWTRERNVLQSDGALYASLEVPYYTPAEYDVRVTFTPLVARDAVIILPLHGVTPFIWKMGAEGNSVCQFNWAAKPKVAHEPDTAFRLGNMLTAGTRMTCVLEVRHTGVRAYLNEHLICDLPTDYKDMDNGGFWNPRNPGVLGIGSWGTPTQFEKIEIAEIRGKGGPLRKPGEVVDRPAPIQLPDDAMWKTAVHLLPQVNPSRDAVAGVWTRKGGELSSDSSVRARIHIPYQPPEEYDLRVDFAHPNSQGEVDILLPRGESALAFRMFVPDVWVAGFSSEAMDNLANPTWCIMPEDKAEGRWSAVFRVRKDGVRAYLNGTLMSNLITSEHPELTIPDAWKLTDGTCLGLGSDQNQTRFKSAELLPVTAEGKEVNPRRELGETQNRP